MSSDSESDVSSVASYESGAEWHRLYKQSYRQVQKAFAIIDSKTQEIKQLKEILACVKEKFEGEKKTGEEYEDILVKIRKALQTNS